MGRPNAMASTSPFTVRSKRDCSPVVCIEANIGTGSAPDISGKGLVNPVAMLLSVGMMLKYSFQQPELAKRVDEAVKTVIDKNIRTKDIGGSASTSDVGDAVAKELEAILKR